MGKSNGERMGPEAIATKSNQSFTMVWIYFFKAGCSSGLGQHQFGLCGNLVLDHYPLPLSTLTQIFPGSAKGLTTLGFLRARAE